MSQKARVPGPRSPRAQLRAGIGLSRDAYTTTLGLQREFGDVVAVGWGPTRYTFVFGAEANQIVLADQHDSFAWRPMTKVLIPVDGDTALVVSDGDDHARRRRVVQPAFGHKMLGRYAEVMREEVERAIAGLAVGQVVEVRSWFGEIIRTVVLRSLFGDSFGARSEEFGRLLERPIAYVQRSPVQRRDIDLPGFAFHRARLDRDAADAIVFDEIAARRRRRTESRVARPVGQSATPDIVDRLLDAADDGSTLSDVEVRDQVVSLVAAGLDTSSAGMAWTLHALSRDDALAGELRESLGDGTHAEGAGLLAAVVSESLRLYPPGPFSGRGVVRDVEVLGVPLRAGSRVVWSPYVTHRMERYWPEPLAFRPRRWLDEHGRTVEPVQFSYVPFGGPYRRCIGAAFARLEMEIMTASWVRRVRCEPAIPGAPEPEAYGVASMNPRGGVRLRITGLVAV